MKYGIDGGDLAYFALANKRWPIVTLIDLDGGTTYRARVASYDYEGTLSAFSPPITFSLPGGTVQRPQISFIPPLAQGSLTEISGSNLSLTTGFAATAPFPLLLSGVTVLVNDVAVPVSAVEINSVTFMVPLNISGSLATVEIIRNGVRSPAKSVSVLNGAAPALAVSSPWALISALVGICLASAFTLNHWRFRH